jgi:DNA-binding transcriptional MerR regulator
MNSKSESAEWARARVLRSRFGLTAPQLARYAQENLIRSSHIRRPGQTRGVRLYHVGDIERLIDSNLQGGEVQI